MSDVQNLETDKVPFEISETLEIEAIPSFSKSYFLLWFENNNVVSFTGNPGMMDFGIGGGHHHHRTASDTASGSSSSGKPGK